MEAFRIKITNTQSAGIEIQPCSDGSVDIVVRYGTESQNSTVSSQNKTPNYKKPFTHHTKQASPEEIIEGMKEVARKLYNQPDTDKDELTKFVKFYEKKIQEDGWNGSFDFDRLYERWISKKR